MVVVAITRGDPLPAGEPAGEPRDERHQGQSKDNPRTIKDNQGQSKDNQGQSRTIKDNQ
jgi:hypothetical protein